MKTFITLFILQTSLSFSQLPTSDCIYDRSSITESFIQNYKTDKFNWDNAKKEARIITNDGDFVYIRKWACETKGVVARVFVLGDYKIIEDDFVKWKNKVVSSAEEFLSKEDVNVLLEYFALDSLKAERYGTDLVFEIPDQRYKKFVVVISPLDNLVIINFLLYD